MSEDTGPESRHFDERVTDRERAIFEGAITLGAAYHQYVGAPFRDGEKLEEAIRESAMAQPYIEEAEIRLNTGGDTGKKTFEYDSVSGEILEMEITAEYGDARAILKLEWVSEMEYPLMYIKSIEESDS